VRAFVVAARPSGTDALRESSLLRAAGIVAYRCVVDEESIGPRPVAENVLRAALGDKAAAEPFLTEEGKELNSIAVLDQLIGCGLLQRSVEATRTPMGFSEDPIAEYLAAMFLFEAEDRRILANLRRRKAWKDSGLAEAVERVEAARNSSAQSTPPESSTGNTTPAEPGTPTIAQTASATSQTQSSPVTSWVPRSSSGST